MAEDRDAGTVVLFGGRDAALTGLGDTWVWDGDGWQDATPAGGPSPHWSGRMAWDPRAGRALLFGSRDDVDRYDERWHWDGAAWVDVSPAGTRTSGRTLFAMGTSEATEEIVVFGGFDGVRRDDTWRWNGQSWTLGPVHGALPRAAPRAVRRVHPRHRVPGGRRLDRVIAGAPRARLHLAITREAANGTGPAANPWGRVRTEDVVVEVRYPLP